jgi:hypothetical protein
MNDLSRNSVSYDFFVRSRIKSSLTFSSSLVMRAYAEAWLAVRAIFSRMVDKNFNSSFHMLTSC